VLRLGSDFLRDFSDHAAKTVYVSDGYGHVGLSHEIYLNRLAREIAGVRVTGNFGSEILRGVTTFKALPGCLPWPTEIEAEIGRCKEQWKTFRNGNEARFATFREVPMLLATTTRLAASQLPVRSPFLDNEVVRLACACPPAVRRKSSVALSLIEGERPELLRIMTDRGAGRTRLALTGALREAWYFNMFRLEYFLNEGMPDLLGGVLDPLGVGSALPMRHKYLHYRQWFRGPLQPYLRETLGSPGAFVRSVMEPAAIERLLSDHARGLRNNETPINTLVTLELIESRILRAH
jgi:asparagine synthase (glutamine-hydrolysing)